jgi:predicted Fe-S protein YdhL (DUF1289 family)
MAEIGSWSSLSPEARRAVMSALEERKATIADRNARSKLYRLPGA